MRIQRDRSSACPAAPPRAESAKPRQAGTEHVRRGRFALGSASAQHQKLTDGRDVIPGSPKARAPGEARRSARDRGGGGGGIGIGTGIMFGSGGGERCAANAR